MIMAPMAYAAKFLTSGPLGQTGRLEGKWLANFARKIKIQDPRSKIQVEVFISLLQLYNTAHKATLRSLPTTYLTCIHVFISLPAHLTPYLDYLPCPFYFLPPRIDLFFFFHPPLPHSCRISITIDA